jgi:nucleoside-diphosphate-sugar epimerase/predicted dehydrogenase
MSEMMPVPEQRNAPLPARRVGGSSSAGGGKRRVGLLGAGYIADWHALALQSVAGVEVVAVCDRAVGRAKALAQKFGVAQVYGSLEEMLSAAALDAVHVLTPPDLHFEAARVVLEAGVDVFLEKPMCARAEDCEALENCETLTRLAEQRELLLGVGHNFLFAEVYERLRRDVKNGVLGLIDDVVITWHRPLPQVMHGPFDVWMLRDPRNILFEVGPHSVAHMLDLVGEPDELEVQASNEVQLPTGVPFYRRWQVNGLKGRMVVDLRFSFVPGFSEYTIHVRGSLAAATVDFERNTYTLNEHRASDPDFEAYGIVVERAKSLKRQARGTLGKYLKSKLKLERRGNPYGASIARAMDAFYGALPLDERVDGRFGARVIGVCERLSGLSRMSASMASARESADFKGHNFSRATNAHAIKPASNDAPARILVLGGTGFIGKELLRQLTDAGLPVRVMARSLAAIPREMRESGRLDCVMGDIGNKSDLLRAMAGVETVFHMARANVKSWADYQALEIEATRRVGECALESGVKRLVYTGTIDSYYCGARAGTITEQTPLDPHIERRNLYARAKAESENILLRMHREQRLPLVIVRPGIVIGRGGSPFHWGVGMWWNDAVCQIWGDGNNKLALVLVEDVAAGLIAAMNAPGIDGRSFNLVGPALLTAREYLDALDAAGAIKIQRRPTPIARFYLLDVMKWMVKLAVRHPERRAPSYRDWESRTGQAVFDCSAARETLGWRPVEEREQLVRLGIVEPFREFMR